MYSQPLFYLAGVTSTTREPGQKKPIYKSVERRSRSTPHNNTAAT